jgi:hypothetical protein
MAAVAGLLPENSECVTLACSALRHSQLISLRTETAVAARQRVALRVAAAGARLAAALMLLTDARRLVGAAATKAACTRCCVGLVLHCTTAMREVAT